MCGPFSIALRFECLTEQAKPAAFETSSGNRRPLGDVAFVEFSRTKARPKPAQGQT
jgi:hypothetical protein